MRADRLLKLADFLETVPRKAFNIVSWQTKAATKPEGKKQGECGFAGCAVGWAVHAKMFRGLKFGAAPLWRRHDPELVYKGETSWEAVTTLFDICRWEAEELFSGGSYPSREPTPKQVAKRIRQFVKATSSPPSGARQGVRTRND